MAVEEALGHPVLDRPLRDKIGHLELRIGYLERQLLDLLALQSRAGGSPAPDDGVVAVQRDLDEARKQHQEWCLQLDARN
jgi:hypothetical protein